MARFTHVLISGGFAAGVTGYRDHYPGQERFSRVVLPVVVEERLTVPAIVDTGAPWCILDPAIARQLGPTVRAEYTPDEKLLIRGIEYKGKLLRMALSLEAEHGDRLDVQATVFVPTLPPGDTWPHPNFIGLDGFLNRVRFAIDPAENAFYFGHI